MTEQPLLFTPEVTPRMVCTMCHFSSECGGCCRKCHANGEGKGCQGQACGLVVGHNTYDRWTTWLYLIDMYPHLKHLKKFLKAKKQ